MSYSGENSTELTKLELEVARWRSVRKLPCQMPRDLWERAATLAEEIGVGRVAQALRLNPTILKRRMAGAMNTGLATFFELLPPSVLPPLSVGECAFEVDSLEGSRLRVVVKDLSAEALASVLRNFAKDAC